MWPVKIVDVLLFANMIVKYCYVIVYTQILLDIVCRFKQCIDTLETYNTLLNINEIGI